MTKIREVIDMLKFNIWTLIKFEFVFKLLSLIIFTPLFMNIFDLTMNMTGYKYLTIENLPSFLLNPLTIFMFILLIALLTAHTMFDITTIIIILDQSKHKKKIDIQEAVKFSLRKCLKVFNLKNFPLAFLVLFLIPFLNFGISSSYITTIKIPEYVQDFIVKNATFLSFFILFSIILTFILLRWIYSMHYYVLEDVDFKEARKRSINLSGKKHIRDTLSILLVEFSLSLMFIISVFVGIFIIAALNEVLKDILVLKSVLTTIVWLLISITYIFTKSLATPLGYACISVLFYKHKEEKNEKIASLKIQNEQHKRYKFNFKKVLISVYVLSIIAGSVLAYNIYKGNYNLNIEHTKIPEVTAHRGASVNYPENTMSAFQGAAYDYADWIELDVQQTKDGQIIVMHDTNFQRTTGINKNTWETDYDEIKELDAGSFFDKKFKKEKIPLLKDAIELAKKNNIKLNIELKPTGYEENFEQKVIDIVKDADFIDECVLASQVYDVLKNIKEIDDEIVTVYVMSFAYGKVTSLEAADHFSVEASAITSSLVKEIHKKGKQLYAWTTNSPETIQKMIDLKVDNIITDDVPLAKSTIYANKTSNIINEYLKLLEKVF